MCVCTLKRRLRVIFAVAVLHVLCLKAHYSNAADLSNRSLAYAKAQAIKKTGGSPATSSYFQRDPFGPNTYAFGFEVNDNRTGNVQFRDERRYVNGTVEGSFGHVRPDGRVIVTHFLSDSERGFLHDTRTFEAADHRKWQTHWPTKRPSIHTQHPPDMPTGDVVYDKDLHLNVTNSKTPEKTANAIKDQHGIDVNATGSATGDIMHTAVQDIIDGKVPLHTVPGKTESHVGFETVNDFLPTDFPIVPFQLPPMLDHTTEKSEVKASQDKYNKAKANNAEKAMNTEMLKSSVKVANGTQASKSNAAVVKIKSENVKPLPLTEVTKDAANGNDAWYQQLIDETRNQFLNNFD
ncbi:PREDICTED: uncharacterized protein LOC108364175 [Rhagoletis zephyria]|uniref:uncharacterized protein LOC108364175 n=1 Tax=Rhagoletis zephyria TaxID=28612 RepID=UPI0008114C42|nr:PREDICTED: uncharacterized protein LOC108364175 [Rhagoletis zephyria]